MGENSKGGTFLTEIVKRYGFDGNRIVVSDYNQVGESNRIFTLPMAAIMEDIYYRVFDSIRDNLVHDFGYYWNPSGEFKELGE